MYDPNCEDVRRYLGRGLILVLFAAVILAMMSPAEARRHKARPVVGHARAASSGLGGSPTDPAKDAALIIDATSGRVLYGRNENEQRHPASLTKMMTLYLLFDALKKNQVNLNTPVAISAHAAAQKPTKLRLRPGDQIPVDTAIKAVVVWSANDVAVAIAEALGGTEGHFAELMTAKARQLGMRNTFYHNASGLPDNLQITTAGDLSILARHLASDFPQYYHYFSTPSFNFRGAEYVTHDNLLARYPGTDGIKTGYTGASGFNLVSSVVRNNIHLVGVVMGGRTAVKRDREMMRLLDVAYDQVAQNPSLAAKANVTWQVAQYTPPPPQNTTISAPPPGSAAGDEDEDTAERRADADELPPKPPAPTPAFAATLPAPSQTKPPVTAMVLPTTASSPTLAPAPKKPDGAVAMTLVPTSRPAQSAAIIPSARPTTTGPVTVASIAVKPGTQQQAGPKPRPAITGEGDATDLHGALGQHDWTIQIGAYADLALARHELAAYADKAMDVLGKAQRIVVPFQSLDGHTLYRARFGPFAEREARQICARLTVRGQTCFAAIATR